MWIFESVQPDANNGYCLLNANHVTNCVCASGIVFTQFPFYKLHNFIDLSYEQEIKNNPFKWNITSLTQLSCPTNVINDLFDDIYHNFINLSLDPVTKNILFFSIYFFCLNCSIPDWG